MIRALAVLLCFAAPAHAFKDGWPALFDVAGVADDDVLNVREAPNASSPIIGSLPPGSVIEVVKPNETGTWGQVNLGEGHGWASLKYLERRPNQMDGDYPEVTTCWGTEPFWHLERRDGQIVYSILGLDQFDVAEELDWEKTTVSHRHRYSFKSEKTVGVISRQYCNDGMSDMENGLELNLILLNEDLHLQGCCSIQPHAE